MECSFNDLQDFFMQFLPMNASCLFALHDDIVDIAKPDRICSLTFVVDHDFGLFLHPSIFTIKDSTSS